MSLIEYFETEGNIESCDNSLIVISNHDLSEKLNTLFFYCNTLQENESRFIKRLLRIVWTFPFYYKARKINSKNAVQSVAPKMMYHFVIPKDHVKRKQSMFYYLVGVAFILFVMIVLVMVFRFYVLSS